MRERWPNERRSVAPNQRWLLRSSSVFLAMTSHTLLLEFAHVGALLGLGTAGGTRWPAAHLRLALSCGSRAYSRLMPRPPRRCWRYRWLWMASRSQARGQLGCRLSLRPLATPLERLPRVEKGMQPGHLA